jgi:hypothetical protein
MLPADLIVPWLNFNKSKSRRQQKQIMCDMCMDQLGILILNQISSLWLKKTAELGVFYPVIDFVQW